MVITHVASARINRVLMVSRTGKTIFPLSPFAPEDLVSRALNEYRNQFLNQSSENYCYKTTSTTYFNYN